ncbi:MAG TPA: hypothetical protein VIH64_00440, partial [Streptosporangiaceae bacterium]
MVNAGDRRGRNLQLRWLFARYGDEARRLGRRAEAELSAETRGKPLVSGQSASLITLGDQEPDDLTGGLLIKRPDRRAPGRPVACHRDLPVGFGRVGQPRVR